MPEDGCFLGGCYLRSAKEDDRGTVNASAVTVRLRRRGLWLEYVTLGWNVVGSVLVLVAAVAARSVALAGFGLDSVIEIVASLVVVWQLQEMHAVERERRALRIIGVAFFLLAAYIAAQSIYVLVAETRPHRSLLGIVWLALTAAAMFALAAGKRATGRALGNRVLETEARVTRDRRAARDGGAGRADPERGGWLVVGRPGCGVRDRLLRRTRGPARAPRGARVSRCRGGRGCC